MARLRMAELPLDHPERNTYRIMSAMERFFRLSLNRRAEISLIL